MPFLKKILTNSYFILAILASVFVLLFSATTSPLYIDHRCWFHGDAGIFQEMGLLILQGGTPYIDLFDHKGPILFFIQALGLWISKAWGLYILQVVSLTMTMIVWHRMVKILSTPRWLGLVVPAITLCFLMFYYQRGDLCEEWCLLFISVPIYYCLREFLQVKTIQNKEFFLSGICVGVISFIRINNVAPIIPFVVYALLARLIDKKYVDMGKAVLNLALGVVSIVLICCLTFYIYAGSQGVYEMLYGTFIFNFSYFSNSNSEFSPFETVCFYVPIVFFFLATFFFVEKKNRRLSLVLLLAYVISLLAIGRSCYTHYRMIFLPLYLLTICLMLKKNHRVSLVSIALLIVFSFYCDYSAIDNLVARLNNKVVSYKDSDFHRFVTSLPEEERCSIFNEYAFPVHYFVEEQLVQCNRLVLPGHIQSSKKLYEDECNHGFCELAPRWVLLPQGAGLTDQKAMEYLRSDYLLVDSIKSPLGSYVHCYKMK